MVFLLKPCIFIQAVGHHKKHCVNSMRPRQESLMAEALEVTPAELDAFADRSVS
mgnify:CR=1 FL=1